MQPGAAAVMGGVGDTGGVVVVVDASAVSPSSVSPSSDSPSSDSSSAPDGSVGVGAVEVGVGAAVPAARETAASEGFGVAGPARPLSPAIAPATNIRT